jgi:NADPH:quinone reductase-like Zn-dependent oxidoreductase
MKKELKQDNLAFIASSVALSKVITLPPRTSQHWTTMATQRALFVKEIGKPLELVQDRPIPVPGSGQVQVKITVTGINPHDQKARDTGLFIANTLPAILTNDVVGKVTKLGEGVTEYAVGDRILYQPNFSLGPDQLGLQEYGIADVFASTKIPDSISDDEAATLPTNIIAPLFALFRELKIPAPWSQEASTFDYAGTSLLVVGGGSSCGKFGVQLAKLAGIGRIVVVGGPVDELTSYGATHVIDRHGGHDAVLGRIRDIVGDELLYAYDAVNPPEGQVLAINALSNTKRGALARLLPIPIPIDESKLSKKQAGYDLLDVFGSSQTDREFVTPFWQRVAGWLVEGKIKPLKFVVRKGLDAAQVNEVLDALRDGKPVTKTHIHIV